MGLDMYLEGKKHLGFNKTQTEDGFELKEKTLELGYWRKHPNLHGYIVQNFAGGKDECQEIELSEENINQIIQAIKDKALPHTTGFFFGSSDESDDQPSIEILEKALAWLKTEVTGEWRSIVYQASW